MLKRYRNEVILTPKMFETTDPRLKIIGVFNPGVAHIGNEILLLVRVAEAPIDQRSGQLAAPRLVNRPTGNPPQYEIDYFPTLPGAGPTTIGHELVRLPHLSHFQIVRVAIDGFHIKSIEKHPDLFGQGTHEEFGIEDPRITEIDGTYYITYVSISRELNVCTSLMSTRDFRSFRRHGVIFACENKDVILHPQKMGGRYLCYHRPVGNIRFNAPSMISASSPNLTDWGSHRAFLIAGNKDAWDSHRIGGGTPALKTPEGWLQIYHGVGVGVGPGPATNGSAERPREYSAGAILTPLEDPSTVLRKSTSPLLRPERDFEINGYISRVVFPTGWVQTDPNPDRVTLYYGCADTAIAAVSLSVSEILAGLLKA